MKKISENIQLQAIKTSDVTRLYNLMKEVYPPAYQHFWKDEGEWYVNNQYAKENILKELFNTKADYYFIVFNNEIVGNFRIIWDSPLGDFKLKSVKLHCIYIHPKVQGKGVGKQLLLWLYKRIKTKGYEMLWLDAMDEKKQAFEFYQKQGFQYYSHQFLPYPLLYDEYRKMSQVYKLL